LPTRPPQPSGAPWQMWWPWAQGGGAGVGAAGAVGAGLPRLAGQWTSRTLRWAASSGGAGAFLWCLRLGGVRLLFGGGGRRRCVCVGGVREGVRGGGLGLPTLRSCPCFAQAYLRVCVCACVWCVCVVFDKYVFVWPPFAVPALVSICGCSYALVRVALHVPTSRYMALKTISKARAHAKGSVQDMVCVNARREGGGCVYCIRWGRALSPCRHPLLRSGTLEHCLAPPRPVHASALAPLASWHHRCMVCTW
jgi:hypothetical protein